MHEEGGTNLVHGCRRRLTPYSRVRVASTSLHKQTFDKITTRLQVWCRHFLRASLERPSAASRKHSGATRLATPL